MNVDTYTPKQFNLSGLKGISDNTLEMHFKLYEGYVKETNRLSARIAEFLKDGRVDQEEMPAYSELTRRLENAAAVRQFLAARTPARRNPKGAR